MGVNRKTSRNASKACIKFYGGLNGSFKSDSIELWKKSKKPIDISFFKFRGDVNAVVVIILP